MRSSFCSSVASRLSRSCVKWSSCSFRSAGSWGTCCGCWSCSSLCCKLLCSPVRREIVCCASCSSSCVVLSALRNAVVEDGDGGGGGGGGVSGEGVRDNLTDGQINLTPFSTRMFSYLFW
ncbi:hypothetical protein E2C01_095720 [Portunus trituberculatus]|uniref:Uncharacterized protein n=1 Tax=Portunus trituberculatus TaxID=210409 RepID=A0A5B7JZK0_PORTR|nr:hypothetical protein [Portunus trituberculatus]